MTSDKKNHSIEELIKKVSTYLSDPNDLQDIRKAYEYANDAHKDQIRKNGDPYITHPLNVAFILTGIRSDKETIMAALLHETVDEASVGKEEIEKNFGPEVAKLVMAVSQLGRINFSTENDYLIEYYKKIIVGMSEDVRVIVIKLADRLHNMRTLWALPEAKQKDIAKETLEILAPIAHHLGIHKIKSELEDLCLRYLKPDVFYDIAERLNNTKVERDNAVNEMIHDVSELLDEHNIKHEIKGRSKSIYSIYKKMDKGKKFSDIYDLLALRVLVQTEQECYLVLGLVHSKYKPVPKRFKDYIANPKANGYQSLHTTVFGEDGNLFEIQIRTYDMNEIAENGIAAHWAYKEHKAANQVLKNVTDQKLQFFKAVMELNDHKLTNEEFVSEMQEEGLNDSIYVYTPKGDVFELPIGATPIDFAYKVHTRVGETMVGATVNDAIVPLNYELHNNDIVKILTNKNSTPSKEWINIAKSVQTKSKIKAFFTKSEREVYIERGKDTLEKELRKKKLSFNDFWSDENRKTIYHELKALNDDDVYLQIGNGKVSAASVIHTVYKQDEEKPKKVVVPKASDADVLVDGIDKVKVTLSNCCNPIPGDAIVGYITRGNGITVHRTNCHNVAFLEERLVQVKWNENKGKKYLTTIVIYSNTRENRLLDLIQKMSLLDVQADNVISRNRGDDAIYEMDVYVRDTNHVNRLILDLEKLPYILKVERIIK